MIDKEKQNKTDLHQRENFMKGLANQIGFSFYPAKIMENEKRKDVDSFKWNFEGNLIFPKGNNYAVLELDTRDVSCSVA